MARYTGPKHKLCRREGIALCNLASCPVIKKNAGPPGQHGQSFRRKPTEYGIQLREKQKVKRLYGVLEKQFKNYYNLANKKDGLTGEVLLQLLENRLDNVVYRIKLAETRQQARQLVSHGHVTVNGKKVTIPSYNVKIGDVIAHSTKAANFEFIKKLAQDTKEEKIPSWLSKKATVGKVKSSPSREHIDIQVNERLIVEHYSR